MRGESKWPRNQEGPSSFGGLQRPVPSPPPPPPEVSLSDCSPAAPVGPGSARGGPDGWCFLSPRQRTVEWDTCPGAPTSMAGQGDIRRFKSSRACPQHTHAPGSGAHIVLGHWCTHPNTGLWPACKSTPRLWCLFSFDPIRRLPPSSGVRSLGKHRWAHAHADLLALRHTWLVRLLAAGLLAPSSVSVSPTALRCGHHRDPISQMGTQRC